jgi:GNAT superfamily N-acetyltransferase
LDLSVGAPENGGMTATELPTAVAIRRGFQAGDIPAIALLHSSNYSREQGFDGAALEAYVCATMAEQYREPQGGELWMAELDGEVVGSIGITRDSDTVARLRWFILAPAARGLGVGQRLLAGALEFVRERGYERVWLSTVAGLDTSAFLYRRARFVLTREWDAETWGAPCVEQRYELDLLESDE